MLYWSLIVLIVAIMGGALGLGGMSGSSVDIAQLPVFMLIAFLVLSLLAGVFKRAR